MRKRTMKRTIASTGLLATVALFLSMVALPVATYALPARAETQTAEQGEQVTTQATTDKKEAAQTRLKAAKLKACENHQKVVTNIMARIAERGQKQINLFSKIAERTEAFYTKKGKTLGTYDALIAEVTTQKTNAQAAVNATKATSTAFTCNGNDPKGVGSTFKEQLKTQNSALKAYKTAVKNLIVGVKSVQSTSSTDKSTTGGGQ